MTMFQYFCSRPVCLVLMVLIVISLFFPLLSKFVSSYYQKKKADALRQ
jgi:TctA family transporter